MIESLWLSMGIPKVVAVVVFPAVMVAVRGLLWAWNQLKRQASRVDDMKTLLELFPDVGTPATGVKQRVHWRAGLHEFDTQTRPSPAHPLLVGPLGLFVLLGWLLAAFFLGVGILLAAAEHFTDSAMSLLYAFAFAGLAAVTTGFDEFDFRYTLMGERLEGESQHLSDIRELRRELGLTDRLDRLADRTYFLRKKYRWTFSRIRHTVAVHHRLRRVKRIAPRYHAGKKRPRTVQPIATEGQACPASAH